MKINDKKKSIEITGSVVSFKRTTNGVMEIWADDKDDLAKAYGYCHAYDRLVQMDLVRIIGQGRLCEQLIANDESLEIDKFMRHMSFAHETDEDLKTIKPEIKKFLDAYSEGVNHYLENNSRSMANRLIGHKPEKWSARDTLLTIKIMAYIGLAQTQQDLEKLIIQMIKGECDIDKLKSLFSPHLDGLSEQQISLIKKSKTSLELLKKDIKFMGALPKFVASNNWVLGPGKTTSGKVIQCNDPHLECNRLPAIWYEFVAHTKDNDYIGVNMPGVPGVIMGRNRDISFGFTYGFMDMVDYFIEDIKNLEYKVEDRYLPLEKRIEVIKRKKASDISLEVYKTSNGYVEYDDEIEDGIHFSRSFSGSMVNSSRSIEGIYGNLDCKTSKDFMELSKLVTISCNWLVGDLAGDIGYQQSGPFPNRGDNSGLYPLEGWLEENCWKGLRDSDQLASLYNPEKGFLVSANEDRNQTGKVPAINMPMGNYRVDRITDLINEKEKLSVDDMMLIQKDLISVQAKQYISQFKHCFPDNELGKYLKSWNYSYDKNSRGAVLFEALYFQTLKLVFGDQLFGDKAWKELVEETGILVDFYDKFDRFLFAEEESNTWFSEISRDEFIKQAFKGISEKWNSFHEIPTWGSRRKVWMNNILFDGKLPKFLGFDYGPITLEGNRATVVQGALYKSHGRVSTFCPSYRYITDLSEFKAWTALAGGPSSKKFSKYYANDIPLWLGYRYKVLGETK